MNALIRARRGWKLLYHIKTNHEPDQEQRDRIARQQAEVDAAARKMYGRGYWNLTGDQQTELFVRLKEHPAAQ